MFSKGQNAVGKEVQKEAKEVKDRQAVMRFIVKESDTGELRLIGPSSEGN